MIDFCTVYFYFIPCTSLVLTSYGTYITCAFCLKFIWRMRLGCAGHLKTTTRLTMGATGSWELVPCFCASPRKLKDIISINGWTGERGKKSQPSLRSTIICTDMRSDNSVLEGTMHIHLKDMSVQYKQIRQFQAKCTYYFHL